MVGQQMEISWHLVSSHLQAIKVPENYKKAAGRLWGPMLSFIPKRIDINGLSHDIRNATESI